MKLTQLQKRCLERMVKDNYNLLYNELGDIRCTKKITEEEAASVISGNLKRKVVRPNEKLILTDINGVDYLVKVQDILDNVPYSTLNNRVVLESGNIEETPIPIKQIKKIRGPKNDRNK